MPIDSYIISAMWRDEKTTSVLKEIFPCDNEHNHDLSKVTGWSNWSTYDTYENFKNNVINKLKTQKNPFDYENEVWIKEAKRRKAKETQSKLAAFFNKELL